MNTVALQEHAMHGMKQLGQHSPQIQAKDKVVSHFMILKPYLWGEHFYWK